MEAELRIFIPEWVGDLSDVRGEPYAEHIVRKLLEEAGFVVIEYEAV